MHNNKKKQPTIKQQVRKASTQEVGRPTRWTASEFSSGPQVEYTSVIGSLTIKMASVYYRSKEATSILVSSSGINVKATGTTSGLTTENSRAGGTRTNSMASASTSAQSQPLPSLGSGRWANESSGSAR